ncbi:hypothetical protein M758_1G088500 [Ceratodon purpureus]|uniref:Uncharacterized protein n=1 Tax=Ceratodon purpureus TaxID=3225 RepID=A0A8T0J6D5_CERPU|nr:hypothetical protein KC19_1G093500 [Ceratodon purpureus]KAG0629244.1 hypothetical protein M758_1G088500 [Ceratodon purpureus]
MAEYNVNVANSDYCCNWDRPVRNGSDLVVYREGAVRHCADNPDWDTHVELKGVPPEHRKQFREQRITQWLESTVPRVHGERFCDYIKRCYLAAELELKQTKRMHLGDEYIHALDRFVFRLFMGFRSKQKVKGVSWGIAIEELILQLLREECLAQYEDGYLQLGKRLCRNPTVFPWPPRSKTESFENTKIPPQLDTITRMDSR